MIKTILSILSLIMVLYPLPCDSLVNPCKRYDNDYNFRAMHNDCVSHLRTHDVYIHTANTDRYIYCCRTHPLKNKFFRRI